MQQIKENYKNPKDQIYGAEIGNLLEKEFKGMIVDLIQNFGNKMEAQINGLEAQIEKIQEMFNKDLEELKNKQSTMSNGPEIQKVRAQEREQIKALNNKFASFIDKVGIPGERQGLWQLRISRNCKAQFLLSWDPDQLRLWLKDRLITYNTP